MNWFVRFYKSSPGKKIIMAVSGVIFFGFVFLHMYGNLKMFMGTELVEGLGVYKYKMDVYAEHLRTFGEPILTYGMLLWILRFVLVLSLVLHVTSAVQLWLMNNKARPQRYANALKSQVTTLFARTMYYTGPLLFLYIVYHILHFTTGDIHSSTHIEGQVYGNVYHAFQTWWIALIYVVAMVILGFHLQHALWSMLQTLGINNPKRNMWRKRFATAFTLIIVLGFIAVPIGIQTGIIPEPHYQPNSTVIAYHETGR